MGCPSGRDGAEGQGLRVCRDCRKVKPLEAFVRDTRWGGYAPRCKPCHADRMMVHRYGTTERSGKMGPKPKPRFRWHGIPWPPTRDI